MKKDDRSGDPKQRINFGWPHAFYIAYVFISLSLSCLAAVASAYAKAVHAAYIYIAFMPTRRTF